MVPILEQKFQGKEPYLCLSVYIQPRASRTSIVGIHDHCLKIRIAAPPVDGEANEALVSFFSKYLEIPRSNVIIKRGDLSRRKTLEIWGVTFDALRDRLSKDGIIL